MPLVEGELLEAARRGDAAAFDRLVAPLRGELHAHCYRMLGSLQDAEDALQDALLGAWRGLSGFEGRGSVRSWLYRIATHACLKLGGRRRRLLPMDVRPASDPLRHVGVSMAEAVWLEPYPETMLGSAASAADPAARYELRESAELAFVAALQHVPAKQRAVLVLREVLAFSAAEVAAVLDTTVASVNSALQRARAGLDKRVDGESQQAALRALGEEGRRELVAAFVAAWERADVPAILDLLVEDARFTMPPSPAWFRGRDDVGRFMREQMFATRWRVVPGWASGQLAFACYQEQPDGHHFRLGALNVVTLRGGRIAEMTGFLDPEVHERFGLSPELSSWRRRHGARGPSRRGPMSSRPAPTPYLRGVVMGHANDRGDRRKSVVRKLIVCTIMSLDGYYEGTGKNVMLLPLDGAFDAYCAERLRAADVLLLGRTTYDGFKGFWPSVADDPNATPAQREISRLDNAIAKVVGSDSLTPDETAPWRETTRIVRRADAHERLAELKRQPGHDILVFGSRTLWHDLLAHGLVDELHLMIGPVVLGGGTSAFANQPDLALRPIDVRTFDGSGNIVVRYEVGQTTA